jgi:hypothetical protein
VTSVGGTVSRAPGAQVRGAVTEVPYWGAGRWDRRWSGGPSWGRWWFHPWSGFWGLFWSLVKLAGLALLLCVTVLLAPRALERASRVAEASWWKAGLVGLAAEILFLPALALAIVLLCITVVGCLLVIPLLLLLPFFLVGIFLLAYAASAVAIGRWLGSRLGRRWSPYGQVLLGMVVIQALPLVGEVAYLAGGWTAPLAILFGLLGELIVFVAVTIGIGAIVLGRSRRAEEPPMPRPVSEPMPEAGPPPPSLSLPPIAQPPIEPAAGGG